MASALQSTEEKETKVQRFEIEDCSVSVMVVSAVAASGGRIGHLVEVVASALPPDVERSVKVERLHCVVVRVGKEVVAFALVLVEEKSVKVE